MTIEAPEDSWGISKMFNDFITELTLEPKDDKSTIVHLSGYYNTIDFKVKLLNFIIMRKMMRKRAKETLRGLKNLVEKNI